MYKYECPECGWEKVYKTKSGYDRAVENNTCWKCWHKNYDKDGNWTRICNGCDKALFYTTQRACWAAEKLNSGCINCHLKSYKMRQITSDRCKGIKRPEIKENKVWRKNLGKASKKHWDNMPDNMRSNIFLKGFETKHGISYDEWLAQLPEWMRYKKVVRTITNRQPLNELENYDKRGKFTYHLDHKISIKQGFDEGILPEIIGDIDNLQMLPWLDNIKKGA